MDATRNAMRDQHNDRTMVERIDPLMGVVLDNRYRIDFRLASGGFGAIYRATHLETGQPYALKVLHTELASQDRSVLARFQREAATLQQLKSPNTIHAYETGTAPDGSLYIVMELLHGESLYEQFRARGPLAWERVVSIGRQVCTSLAEAHALGIIHRDLKPANIHLEGNADFVKVLDFGIAKITRDSGLDSTELTQAGQMIGTFDYMAPEQMVGGECTGKTDIYTLGVVLYEMICGRRPFGDAASPTAMLAALLTQTPPPLGVPGVPAELERILLKCLEREPQHRWADVEELAAALDHVIPREVRTIKLHTPSPVIVDSEATVVAQPRAKRGTPPQPYRDDAPPTLDGRPRRGSEPPPSPTRAKRDSATPSPNVIRNPSGEARPKRDSTPHVVRRERDSQPVPLVPAPRAHRDSQPVPLAPRAHRDSQPVPLAPPARAHRDSQPVPLAPPAAPAADPSAWQSLQMPKRSGDRESGPVARYDGRDSQPVPMFRDERDGSQPVKAAEALPSRAGYPQASPTPAPIVHTPAPIVQTPAPIVIAQPPAPLPATPPAPDPRASLAAIDPNAWRHQTPSRGSMLDARTGYDMAGSQSRDVLVRRIVWALALVLGIVLVIVIANRL